MTVTPEHRFQLAERSVTQDDQAGRRGSPLGQRLIAQGCGGKGLQPHVLGMDMVVHDVCSPLQAGVLEVFSRTYRQ